MALSPVRLRASMSVGSADTIAFTRSNSPALIASMKAALLEVASGMHRFYRGRCATAGLPPSPASSGEPGHGSHRSRATGGGKAWAKTAVVVQTFRSAVCTAIVLGAVSAHAQPPPAIEQPLL